MFGVFRILEARRIEVFAEQLVLKKISDRTPLQTDPILSCFAAASSNTAGRHCRKNARKTTYFRKRKKSRLGLACTARMCVRCSIEAKSA